MLPTFRNGWLSLIATFLLASAPAHAADPTPFDLTIRAPVEFKNLSPHIGGLFLNCRIFLKNGIELKNDDGANTGEMWINGTKDVVIVPSSRKVNTTMAFHVHFYNADAIAAWGLGNYNCWIAGATDQGILQTFDPNATDPAFRVEPGAVLSYSGQF